MALSVSTSSDKLLGHLADEIEQTRFNIATSGVEDKKERLMTLAPLLAEAADEIYKEAS